VAVVVKGILEQMGRQEWVRAYSSKARCYYTHCRAGGGCFGFARAVCLCVCVRARVRACVRVRACFGFASAGLEG
jgi:hypothetical protein